MKKVLIAAAALMAGTAALAQTPVAPAAPPAPPVPMAHPMADKVMTRTEVVAMVREHFGRLDADKNGSITKEEVTQGRMKRGENVRTFRMRRGEGAAGEPHVMLHRAPIGDPNAAFDRLDENKDGMVSRDEFAKAREERIERRVVVNQQGGTKSVAPGGKRNMRMNHMGGVGRMGRMIVMADTDKDGKITLAEAEAMALQHFDQIDTNRDGQVTPEERRSGRPIIIKSMQDKKMEL